jgi:hypothetical protein
MQDAGYKLNEQLFDTTFVDETISQFDFGNTIGADIFSGEILKDKNVRHSVVRFITDCLNNNKFPAYLREFRLTLLSKNALSEVAIEDTRPIAIGIHHLKIIEKCIKHKSECLKSKLFETDGY